MIFNGFVTAERIVFRKDFRTLDGVNEYDCNANH